jgi:hypothetical protein
MADLESQYRHHVLTVARELTKEHGYRPTYFLREVEAYGSVEAARRVIGGDPSQTTDGFTRLWELKLLRRTVEFDAQLPWWAPLFSDAQRAVARQRLLDHRYAGLDHDIAAAEPPSWYGRAQEQGAAHKDLREMPSSDPRH